MGTFYGVPLSMRPLPVRPLPSFRLYLSPCHPISPQPTSPFTHLAAAGQQTRQQKQRDFLEKRRKLFLQAALDAKKAGDKASALEYLRSAKGFEPLLEATENGLPVNMDTVGCGDLFLMVISLPCLKLFTYFLHTHAFDPYAFDI